jgi:predicted nucleotidyltransferase
VTEEAIAQQSEVAVNVHTLAFLREPERRATETFIGRVRRAFPEKVQQIILYGSKARRTSHAHSDIDVLLIAEEEDWRFRHAISGVAADVSLEYDVLISPRVIARERWGKMRRRRFTFYTNVQADGVELYSVGQVTTVK